MPKRSGLELLVPQAEHVILNTLAGTFVLHLAFGLISQYGVRILLRM